MKYSVRRFGFSLLELLAVVTILGIIAAVVVPRITASSRTARENACFTNKAEINEAVERYYLTTGSLPSSLKDLDTNEYFPSGIPVCPVSGHAYTLNASTKRVFGHNSSGKLAGFHP